MKSLICSLIIMSSLAAHAGNTDIGGMDDLEPLCAQAALLSATAFRAANQFTYDQRETDSLEVSIPGNMSLKRESIKQLGKDKFLETYLVQIENARFVEDVARIIIEAYNKDQGFCVVKSVSESTKAEAAQPAQSVLNKAKSDLANIKGQNRELNLSMCKRVKPVYNSVYNEWNLLGSSKEASELQPLLKELTSFMLKCP